MRAQRYQIETSIIRRVKTDTDMAKSRKKDKLTLYIMIGAAEGETDLAQTISL